MTTQQYRQASERFMAQARRELAVGDLPQASEKGWGAAVQVLKAAHAYPVCHREERSDVAISLPEERPLQQRDCRAPLAMTLHAKWVRVSSKPSPNNGVGNTAGTDTTSLQSAGSGPRPAMETSAACSAPPASSTRTFTRTRCRLSKSRRAWTMSKPCWVSSYPGWSRRSLNLSRRAAKSSRGYRRRQLWPFPPRRPRRTQRAP